MCKPVIYKLKILGGGNLNIINLWGKPQEKGEPNFWSSVGGSKRRGEHDFWLKVSGRKTLEETMGKK